MAPQVNGDIPSSAPNSAFLQHLLDYPVISDSIHTIKSNELGQRTIALGDSAYHKFAAPVLPWLAKPYGYVSPYVQKADSIGDQTLGKIDERFPVVKKPTADLYKETRELLFLPYNKGIEGRDHVYGVYSDEYKKNEQAGVVGYGRAAVATAFVVSNETLSWLSSFLAARKQQTTQAVNEKINQ